MDCGHFYFISDSYFEDFQDSFLMKNKELLGSGEHNRPCFYAFRDSSSEIFWLIPISSQVEKYKKIYRKKTVQHGFCDTIVFGEVLGSEKAFLIQNMCPVTEKYISNEYLDSMNVPVRVNGVFEKELVGKAKKILLLQRRGVNIIFPDVLNIERFLTEKTD